MTKSNRGDDDDKIEHLLLGTIKLVAIVATVFRIVLAVGLVVLVGKGK